MNYFREILDYEDFEAKININGFRMKISTSGVGISIKFLLEEMKPVVLVNFEFGCRQNPKKELDMGFVRILLKKSDDSISSKIPLSKCEVADSDPHEGNQNYSFGETLFRQLFL